jgi:hypothetical protein
LRSMLFMVCFSPWVASAVLPEAPYIELYADAGGARIPRWCIGGDTYVVET